MIYNNASSADNSSGAFNLPYLSGVINYNDLNPNERKYVDIYHTDISQYPDSVKLYLTIRNSGGKLIMNLAPPYNINTRRFWKVTEQYGNTEVIIKDFDVLEYRENDGPGFTSSFVLDYSGSMHNEIQNVENALRKVVPYIREGKDIFDIIQFDHRVFNPVKLCKNPDSIRNILSFNMLRGATAFYQASFQGLNNIKNAENSKVAILFTDGMDNASFFISANQIVANARTNNIKVFVIGYGYASKDILKQIAEQTGGKAYFPQSLAKLDQIFSEIYQQVKVYYTITYRPSCNDSNRIKVTVSCVPRSPNCTAGSGIYFKEPVPIPCCPCPPCPPCHSGITFDSGSCVVDATYIPIIDMIADNLRKNPNTTIDLVGHSDSSGDMASQTDISLCRAHAVYDALVRDRGVNTDQIINIKGKGNDESIYPKEEFPWQTRENNRVEIIFR
ncbi:MAG: VWA domain-containing protein [Chlorobi bacterium]|nr:VWA domain-containing protein [Chlorobiota bacterium]